MSRPVSMSQVCEQGLHHQCQGHDAIGGCRCPDPAHTRQREIAEVRAAATKLRETASRVPQGLDDRRDWEGHPWQVEACQDGCECIVYHGVYVEDFLKPQVPPIQYVADAETPEHAAWIALMSPEKAPLLAGLLESLAKFSELTASPLPEEALPLARSLNGTTGGAA